MAEVVLVIHLLIALALIGSVLMQRSEGGALGIGGGGGGGMFNARGAGNALTRTTAFLAAAFFVTSITLTILTVKSTRPTSVFDKVPAGQTAPVLPKLPPASDPKLPKIPSGQ